MRRWVVAAIAVGVLGAAPAAAAAPARDRDAGPRASAVSAAPAAAKQRAPRCRRTQVRVAVRGRRARCIPVRTLAKGLPRTSAALLGSIVGAARPARAAKGSIASALGDRGPAVFDWEDRLVAAGQRAIAARKRALGIATASARISQTDGTDNDLGLQLAGPLDWAVKAGALIKSIKEGGSNLDTGRTTEQTKGTLISLEGESFSFELQGTDGVQVKCPKQGGIVEATGTFKGTRTYKPPGAQEPITETVTGTFKITGRVDRKAKLTSYDVEVSVADSRSATPTTGTAKGVRPRATAKESAIITSSSVGITGASGREKLVTAAIGYAQREGLAFVQDAEAVFNRQASCLEAVPTPKVVKSGTQKQVTIRVKSRITGQPVESDLTLEPSGGATVSPKTITTTPSKPAKVQVKMPAKGKGSRVRAAAAKGSVAITGLSERGRARGTVGSDEVPETFEVAFDVRGEGRFATHDATGTFRSTIVARRQGDGTTWKGSAEAAWSDLSATSKVPECAYASPLSGGTLGVELTSTGGNTVKVTWTTPNGAGLASSFTVTCTFPPNPPAIVAGQPGPSLVPLQPDAATLPITGGTQALTGSITVGGDGFFTNGTLTVTPGE